MTGSNIGLIILAAGASTRLGQPKQLLLFQGKTLLIHTIEQALSSRCCPIIVVLGSQAEHIKLNINSYPIFIVKNPNWEQGMSASIQTGIKQLQHIQPDSKGVVITLCDQPFISSQIIDKLVETYQQTQYSIVVSEYNNILGVPALFSNTLFRELMNLDTKTGAKSLIHKYSNERSIVPFPLGIFDIDTPQDYENLLNFNSESE
jgi:molybdenum cofactor cytidylyltransferase